MARDPRPTGAPDDSGAERTYGIWGLVALFVALAVAGLVLVLFFGAENEESVRVPTTQTLPEGFEEPAATSTTAAGASTTPTFPDGAPAPDGASAIDADAGTTSIAFDPPPGTTDDGGDLVDGWTAVIAPVEASADDDGTALVIRVSCARSADEFLAQLTVTEADTVVTVGAVVVAPDGGPPCGGAEVVHTVPLGEPLAERTISVLPEGTEVGDLG